MDTELFIYESLSGMFPSDIVTGHFANILLGIVIVVLFAILDRLGDMYYADEPESIQMTKEELKAWLKEKE